MLNIKVLFTVGVFLPSVICNCRQSSQENADMGFTNMMIPNFIQFGEICGDLRNGQTDVCSKECKETVNSMTATYPWLFECDCQHGIKRIYTTNDCLADRQKLPICFEPENSCTKMYKVCNDSSTCRAKLNSYSTDCKDEFEKYEREIGCDTVCMFAYEELLADTDAEGLWDCSCDDSAQDWCRRFINRTDCSNIDYSIPISSSDGGEETMPSSEDVATDTGPELPSCLMEMRAYCDGDLNCENIIGGDLFLLVDCDQPTNGEMYNCSSECAMKVQQMKKKYPFLYECDCQSSLPVYEPDVCSRDKERYEYCVESNPSCSELIPCLDEPSNCSNHLYNFLTNCSSDMFSKDLDDMQCTTECKTAFDRLSNSTEGVTLTQCRCGRKDKLCKSFQEDLCAVLTMPSATQCRCGSKDTLCKSFQEDLCAVLTMPSASNRLAGGFLMTCFVLFITFVQKL